MATKPATITGRGLLTLVRERGPQFGSEALEQVERAKATDRPPEDKWSYSRQAPGQELIDP